MFIIENYKINTLTVECRPTINTLFLYFGLFLGVKLDSLSCSLTSISYTEDKILINFHGKRFFCLTPPYVRHKLHTLLPTKSNRRFKIFQCYL